MFRSLEYHCPECTLTASNSEKDRLQICFGSHPQLVKLERYRLGQGKEHSNSCTGHLIQDPICNAFMATVDNQVGKNIRRRKEHSERAIGFLHLIALKKIPLAKKMNIAKLLAVTVLLERSSTDLHVENHLFFHA